MKRINLVYGGQNYSVSNRDLDDLQDEIAAGLNTGAPYWLVVNHGEGIRREARLLITPGAALALLPIPTPNPDPALTTNQPAPPPAR